MSIHILGALIALGAAISWGGGDFSGGYAARKINHFQVLFLTSLSSLSLLLILAIVWVEGIPSTTNAIYAILAGTAGALGLAAFYKGLSIGNVAIVAPVGGVIGSIIPVLFGIFIQGFPGYPALSGFALALLGIWLVTKVENGSDSNLKSSLGLATLAGLGFGGFLTLIAQIDGEQIFAPLVVAKFTSLLVAFILIRQSKQSMPKFNRSGIALLSGVLDAGGNMLYLLAIQFTRLDIAALLSSLYPAGTVLLSTFILKEKTTISQWIGVALCITAIMLITL
ncbi:MAG: DMT family transporter [Anaerolineales bacterium]|nr:DMT family transporter [Chloroflexota bacterium]MBL6981773.1 DMT family transporter [Anaerolineales bacterium]